MCNLEVRMYSLEALGLTGQLAANVVAVGKDGVEVGPSSLD